MKEITAAEFEKVITENKKVVVDFYSTECPPCEALAPKFDAVADLYGKEITFVKMYRQGNRELADKLGVKSSPTVIFYENGIRVGSTLTGGIKRSELIEGVNSLLPSHIVADIQKNIVKTKSSYDTVIIGGGPAGLAAAIYLGQAKVKTVLIDRALPGGQVSTTHQVSNYPGFVEPIQGYMLSHYMSEQAHKTGVDFKSAVEISALDVINKTIEVDGIETIHFKKLILASGASPRPLGIAGENEYRGKGISYCATCDAKYFEDKEVIVIGGGNSAVEESDFISKFAKKITIIHQFDKLSANKEAQEKIFANPKISIKYKHEPRAFIKTDNGMSVEIENLETKQIETISADGVFVFIGMQPNLEVIGNLFERDAWGYIQTNEDMQTSIPNIYAVGDVISKKYRQITTAVADGTIASIAISKELA